MELYSRSSQLCMSNTRGRLGCTECSARHKAIREEQKCQDLQIKNRTWSCVGKHLVPTREKESVREARKTLWSLLWKEYWHTRVLFLIWPCIPKARFGSPIKEDATLDNVFNSTSLLGTNCAGGHILSSIRRRPYIQCHWLKICFRENS